MKTIPVQTSKPYAITIGAGLLDQVGATVAALGDVRKAFVVTDSNVAPLYADRLLASLAKKKIEAFLFVFQAGEKSKNRGTLFHLIDGLADKGLTSTDAVIALGGGVVGDVAGLAAALYLRGIRLVQVPTSLLAMVDSSVGGKTAIDLPAGKNLCGAFYQPDAVVCDPALATTLPRDIFAAGCAEIIKYAFIDTPALLSVLRTGNIRDHLEEVIAESVTRKRDLVVADEHDRGERHLLNLGHTIGHAIECASAFSVSHGQAVAIGMVAAAEGAWRSGWSREKVAPVMKEILVRHGLPVSASFAPGNLLPYIAHDKKRTGDTITLVIPETIGHCSLRPVSIADMGAFLEKGLVKCE